MKHLHFNITGSSIGWIEWNQIDSSVNLISRSFIEELNALIKQIESSQIKVLVFISGKENNFCSGADIRELQKTQNYKQIESLLNRFHFVFSKFENLKISKIAAINGACLGGGLELALCFNYRLASSSIHTKLGFPEVQLGLIPGLGGCIRLPKLIGLKESLKFIVTGNSLNTQQAFSIGLVDEKIPPLILKKRVLELAQQVIEGKMPPYPKNSYKNKKNYAHWLEALFKPIICFISKKQTLKKTKGFYPAPLKAIQLINNTYYHSFYHSFSPKDLKQEISTFTELLKSQAAKSLIRLWTLIDKAKKINITSKNYKAIQRVAVIGAGVMGSAISYLLADKGIQVRLIDSNAGALSKALKKTKNLLEKKKTKGEIDTYELEKKFNNLSVSQNFWGAKTFDLIIEALPENLGLKQKLIAEISKKTNTECLFASNTSSFSILDLAKNSSRPSHFLGLHFFNPAHKMSLLEVCMTESQKQAFGQIIPFIKQLGKIPLFVKDSPGFVVNRILAVYLSECLNLFEEGCNIQYIDTILTHQLGMPLGPFELMDKIGIDLCLSVIFNLKQKGLSLNIPIWTKDLTHILAQGEKSKCAFYIYKEDGRKILNPKTNTLNKGTNSIKDKQILQRIINKISIEKSNLIKDKIVQREEDIDLAMILGAGFPALLKIHIH